MGNRIITCSDGTWNKPGAASTNVERIFQCIADQTTDGKFQYKAYDQGVGTGASFLDKFIGGATGSGLTQNIKDMYLFLCMNYQPGDDIYLFGFSRGAYTARSLAGFIYNCSILKPENIHLVNTAFDLYRNRNPFTKPSSSLMASFRRNYCFERPKIKFIGVWDTVGSLGVPISFFRNQAKFRFHDCQLNREVEHAYHALAIDERRSIFSPTLWEMTEEAKHEGKQVLEQRWFPGVHSNVGGGYPDHGLSDIALKWLMDKAAATGLYFNPELLKKLKPEYKPVFDGKKYSSHMALPYVLLPLSWRWRKMMTKETTNETIDESVHERLKLNGYKPKNVLKLLKQGLLK